VKLSVALRGIRQLAFDTVALVYFVEKNPAYFDRMLFIMSQVDSGLVDGVASSIALTEVLIQPIRTGNIALAQSYETVLSDSENFQVMPISIRIARLAADMRARHNLKIADALHVATALESGCEAFLTNDLALKRITEIKVLVLDELELDLP
jgi:predicted nucleic acid-binding protein